MGNTMKSSRRPPDADTRSSCSAPRNQLPPRSGPSRTTAALSCCHRFSPLVTSACHSALSTGNGSFQLTVGSFPSVLHAGRRRDGIGGFEQKPLA